MKAIPGTYRARSTSTGPLEQSASTGWLDCSYATLAQTHKYRVLAEPSNNNKICTRGQRIVGFGAPVLGQQKASGTAPGRPADTAVAGEAKIRQKEELPVCRFNVQVQRIAISQTSIARNQMRLRVETVLQVLSSPESCVGEC